MVDRDITGEIRRSSLNRLPALLGIDDKALKEIADRVRQFDVNQSNDTRQRKALEKISQQIGQSTLIESRSERFGREWLRRREVESLELMAVAQAYPHEELRQTPLFEALLHRVKGNPMPAERETRNEGEQTREQ
jgi:hypothetical protein